MSVRFKAPSRISLASMGLAVPLAFLFFFPSLSSVAGKAAKVRSAPPTVSHSETLSVLEGSRKSGSSLRAYDLFRLNESRIKADKSARPPDIGGSRVLPGTLGVDLLPGAPVFQTDDGAVIIDEDQGIDTEITVGVGARISAVIRLLGTEDLLGITFDFSFDKDILELVDMRETRMDLDFSGQQDPEEREVIKEFFQSGEGNVDEFQYTYNDGTGEITTQPGILVDLNGNGKLDPFEYKLYEKEYIHNQEGTDIPFWTEVVSRREGYNESVEVFDTVMDINQNGEGNDNTVVLLRRPETPASGFGFDGDAILFELRFRAKSVGDCSITLENAQGIQENFSDIRTDVYPVETTPSSSIVRVVPESDPQKLLNALPKADGHRPRFQQLMELIQTWMK